MKQPLDIYDMKPKAMVKYLSNYGWHFNKKACDMAVKGMKKNKTKIDAWSKEQVDDMLSRFGINLKNNAGYDYVYVANMCKAYYYKSGVPDEQHVAMYIRDVIDDEDDADGNIMRTWVAKMTGNGELIEWEDLL